MVHIASWLQLASWFTSLPWDSMCPSLERACARRMLLASLGHHECAQAAGRFGVAAAPSAGNPPPLKSQDQPHRFPRL